MATDDLDNQMQQHAPRGFWTVLAVVAGSAALFAVWLKYAGSSGHSGLPAGTIAPNLQAEGWLNGEEPKPNPPPGRVRLLHAWFTTCPACYQEAPELVRLHQEFAPKGVEFVGLTYESADRLPEIENYLKQTGITWVNGFGALATLREYGVEYFPSIWIVNSEGKVLWNLDSGPSLEGALRLAIGGKLDGKSQGDP